MKDNNYDDLPDSPRPEGKKGKVLLVALICVVLTLIGFITYAILAEPVEKNSTEAAATPAESSIAPAATIPSAPAPVETPKEQPVETVNIPEEVPAEKPSEEKSLTTPEETPAVEPELPPQGNPAEQIEEPKQVEEVPAEDDQHLVYQYYLVNEGDTVASIAENYGVSTSSIISVNGIKSTADIQKGKTLMIPEVDGLLYTVREGDSMDEILSRFNTTLSEEDLLKMNGAKEVEPGSNLFIPYPDEQTAVVKFNVPVENGYVLYSYGQMYRSKVIEGTVLASSAGSPVFVELEGSVSAIGTNEYGNYVELEHSNGYVSIYNGLERVFVKVGQKVSAEDVMGTIGRKSSYFGVPACYLQIQQNGLSFNPELYL